MYGKVDVIIGDIDINCVVRKKYQTNLERKSSAMIGIELGLSTPEISGILSAISEKISADSHTQLEKRERRKDKSEPE